MTPEAFGSISEPKHIDFSILQGRKRDSEHQNVAKTIGFTTFSKKKKNVAATALVERPPFSCHSNFFFGIVVKPMVLGTFLAGVEAERPRRLPKQPLLHVRTP